MFGSKVSHLATLFSPGLGPLSRGVVVCVVHCIRFFLGGWYLFGMTIEDVAEKADVWSEAIKKIVKAIAAAVVALATAIGALLAWWPSGEQAPPPPALIEGTGYGPQCSQLYNTIDHTWTESQWTVWESLRRDLQC